jgi:hypothetical protein
MRPFDQQSKIVVRESDATGRTAFKRQTNLTRQKWKREHNFCAKFAKFAEKAICCKPIFRVWSRFFATPILKNQHRLFWLVCFR